MNLSQLAAGVSAFRQLTAIGNSFNFYAMDFPTELLNALNLYLKEFSFEFQWVNSQMDGLRLDALNLMESRIYRRTAGGWELERVEK